MLVYIVDTHSYMSYYEQYLEFDPFITPSEPSNPWISENTDYWEQESSMYVHHSCHHK